MDSRSVFKALLNRQQCSMPWGIRVTLWEHFLADEHSVLRDDTLRRKKKTVPLSTDADHQFHWEIDPETGEAFPFNGDE